MGKRNGRRKNKVMPKYRSQSSNTNSIEKKTKENKIFGNIDLSLISYFNEKMSQILLDFAEPVLNSLDNNELTTIDNALYFSVAVWNLSIMPRPEQKEAWDKIVKTATNGNTEIIGEVEATIRMLLDRKQKHFANNKRSIISYELGMRDGELKLDVISTLE